MRIEIDVAKHCPVLVQRKLKGLNIEINPKTESTAESSPCFVGDEIVDATIANDLYTSKKTVEVELKCSGCAYLDKGFVKIVKRKI